ncbi:FAD-dependent oxidoreductase [Lactiplantibacillus plantarum]|uniref:FAD-dependent oxidoreductase n=1 Tax=Lactiplantibacillus plantarum TaxID=1590 RepID=UPI00280A5819|nr:FAD-dependent oxidoreductase [Lactiplantibacillus plantarum]
MDRHNGAILINDYVQTSDPDIYAAGDACVVRIIIPRDSRRIHRHWQLTHCAKGALAGINVFRRFTAYRTCRNASHLSHAII